MRVSPPLLATLLLSTLACAGLPSGLPTGTPPPAAPAVATEDISLSSNGITAALARTDFAGQGDAGEKVLGRFVVMTDEDVEIDERGAIRAGRHGQLGANWGRAKAKRARKMQHHEGQGHLYTVDADDEAALNSLSGQDGVAWVEPVYRYKLSSSNDPYYKYQWDMQSLKVDQVHSLTTGQGVTVAVVDSGVSPGPDGPAHVLRGWDFVDNDDDASDSAAAKNSPNGAHGTHVAGTIAQTAGNGKGVVGLAPGVSILPVRVSDYLGVTSDLIADGITYAVDHGAQVINLSMGGSTPSRVIEEACNYAYKHGVVLVAAAGNDGWNNRLSYPAAYSNVIAVGAHDIGFHETDYSNHGSNLLLLAPGGDTRFDRNNDGKPDGILQETLVAGARGYAMMQGTSMATPHVTAAVALLISQGITGPDRIRQVLQQSADMVGGNRILNVMAALTQAPSAPVADAPGRNGGPAGGPPRGAAKTPPQHRGEVRKPPRRAP